MPVVKKRTKKKKFCSCHLMENFDFQTSRCSFRIDRNDPNAHHFLLLVLHNFSLTNCRRTCRLFIFRYDNRTNERTSNFATLIRYIVRRPSPSPLPTEILRLVIERGERTNERERRHTRETCKSKP